MAEVLEILKYDKKGNTVAIVSADLEAIVDCLVDEVTDKCYERPIARVTLPNGAVKLIQWQRSPGLIVVDTALSAATGMVVGVRGEVIDGV